jgi:BTB/POZ domain
VLSVELLTKDPFSLLAACCRLNPPFHFSDERNASFDRDWWLFRHIVTYLRTGLLPDELDTLTELYTEACYFRLEALKKSIEDVPVGKLKPKLPLQRDRRGSSSHS